MGKNTYVGPEDIFSGAAPRVYTMPSGTNFLTLLARTLQAALGESLKDVMIFLPTRRAVRGLADSFLELSGGKAVMLPIVRTLADMDENEPPFAFADANLAIPQAIPDAERHFALSKLIAAKMNAEGDVPVDAAAALAMADPLISVLNDLAMEALPLSSVRQLSNSIDLLPEHQQNAAAFIDILSTIWPEFLKEKGLIEPMERRVRLLDAASDKWKAQPPDHPVIVAGSTGTLKATARFIKTIAELPKGLVVLPGLDLNLDEDVWTTIDDQHPQAALRRLLATIGITREAVSVWPGVNRKRSARTRERVLAESLIPVESTADWPSRIAKVERDVSDKGGIEAALEGLSLIEARTSEEEASVLALIVRDVLQDENKTCALVTPDPALVRRVRAKLSRFGIDADTSAGDPLEETAHGAFLTYSLTLAADPFDPVSLNNLYTHALFQKPEQAVLDWHKFEAAVLRGPRVKNYELMQERADKADVLRGVENVKALHETLAPLTALMAQQHCPSHWARAHIKTSEAFAGSAAALWSGEAGEKAAAILQEILQYGSYLPPVDSDGYAKLLSTLMRGRVVRPRYGTEARLKILGPLEARMIVADTILLCGLNEGVWPAHPAPHPLLSRGMRQTIGLTMPERRFGQSAHDFAELANHQTVIMTRAMRSDDGPQVMSRWLWRLKTLVKGAKQELAETIFAPENPYLEWARMIDHVPEVPVLSSRPMPRPSLDRRWPKNSRKLSVTQIQNWIRDPYWVYATKILGLSPLDLPDLPLDGRAFGKAVHRALELGMKAGQPTHAQMLAYLKGDLESAGYAAHAFARMLPNLEETAAWTVEWIGKRRADGWTLAGAESYGKIEILAAEGHAVFTLSGIADLIETRNGQIDNCEASVVDFKTGSSSSAKVIKAGFDPQLPLLAIMAQDGAFGPKLEITNLSYVKPTKQEIKLSLDGDVVESLAIDTLQVLKDLIISFDQPDTAYYSQPRAQYKNPYGDFDHLARRAEWAVLSDESGGQYE